MTTPVATLRDRIERALARLRPALRADGGDVEIVAVDEQAGRVELRFLGACRRCPASSYTLAHTIRSRLLQEVAEVRTVVAV